MKSSSSTSQSRRASRRVRLAFWALAVAIGTAVTAHAQENPGTTIQVASPVLTVDRDAMFSRSALGRRILAVLEQDRTALATENRQIEAELSQEEAELTRIRPSLLPHEFTERANAFNDKVQAFRTTQDGKARDLQRRFELERQRFFESATQVLASIAQDRGALVVLDNNVVLLAVGAIDVTGEAIERLNASVGDGVNDLSSPLNSGPAPLIAPNGGGTTLNGFEPAPTDAQDTDSGALSGQTQQ